MAKKGTVRATMPFSYVCFVIHPHSQRNNGLTNQFYIKKITLQYCLKFAKEFKKDFLNLKH